MNIDLRHAAAATPPKGNATPTGEPAYADGRAVVRLAQMGLLLNAVLAGVKLVAGLVGNSYALVADAIESSTDMIGSLVVWSGLRIASRSPDDRFPFGYGRAEPLAAVAVAALMFGAATGIAIEAIREIRVPHHAPAPFTLAVLATVIVVKELMAKRVFKANTQRASVVAEADAWHHRADAITSAAAFAGISVALIGGAGWESADDWAALVAVLVIFFNGAVLIRRATLDLMDQAPDAPLREAISRSAQKTPGVLAIEKVNIRKSGAHLYVDLHVQADPLLSLRDAHVLSGCVKSAIRSSVPSVTAVLIHMEPYEPPRHP